MSTKHSKAAEKFLQDSKMAAWHNETLWMVRAKRDKMSKEVPEWEELRNKACELKLYSNSHLEELLQEFEKNATANGAIVHWAKDADEYCAIVYEILNEHNVHHFIKSKSMLAEECGLNPFLMERGIDVVESDLGERILQLMHLEPSHIVLPAIHIKREQVGELFEKEMGTEKGNFDPTYLTHAARKNLRHLFLNAEAAMTGANFAVASTGDIVVCTNEGNADMGTSYPKLNIAAFGMEKIVPDLDALGVFTRLLARSATGQPVTTYTSHYRRPREGGEYHIIIVDNGRSTLLSKPDHIKTLNCIRCGACMNTCPVYRRSGGYSYTYFIPGPIGINLGMAHDPEKYYDNLSACSLCMSCSDVCPVKVDLAEQIYKWRQDLDGLGKANTGKKIMSGGMKFLMERPALFNAALWAAPMVNSLPRFMKYNDFDDWGKGRELPEFAKESFNEMWKKNEVQGRRNQNEQQRRNIGEHPQAYADTLRKAGYSGYETFDVSGQNRAILRYQPGGRWYGSGIGRRRRCECRHSPDVSGCDAHCFRIAGYILRNFQSGYGGRPERTGRNRGSRYSGRDRSSGERRCLDTANREVQSDLFYFGETGDSDRPE